MPISNLTYVTSVTLALALSSTVQLADASDAKAPEASCPGDGHLWVFLPPSDLTYWLTKDVTNDSA